SWMFVHVHVESFTEYATGAVLRAVECERCRAKYFYELARFAKGTGSAVYGIGKEAARKRAKRAAEKKLTKLLQRDNEAVPCPNCKWLQSEMVQDLRARRHELMRHLGLACNALTIVIIFAYSFFWLTDNRIADLIARWTLKPTIALAAVGAAMTV